MSKWIGYAVSVNCGEPLGCYQGTILDADGTTITLTKAFRNGFPYPKSQVTLNAADIKDLKIIETRSERVEQTHSTVALSKTNKKAVRATVCENLQANPSSSVAGNQQGQGNTGGNSNKNGNTRSGPTTSRSKPIDIQSSRPIKNNNQIGSYGHSGSTPRQRGGGGGGGQPAGGAARRRNEACFGDEAEPGTEADFDFEGNLALFNKQALWQQMNSQKPDLVRQTDEGKFRHDENVLGGGAGVGAGAGAGAGGGTGGLRRAIRVPDALRGPLDYVTDEGVCVPSVCPQLRHALWEGVSRAGLAEAARVLLARGAADVCLRLVGGGRRLEPRNAHQAPTVVVLAAGTGGGAAGAVGAAAGGAALVAARLLVSHNVRVACYLHRPSSLQHLPHDEAISRSYAALSLSGVTVVERLEALPRPDLVLLALHDVTESEEECAESESVEAAMQWAGAARAACVALEPPPRWRDSWPRCRAAVLAALPAALPPALGRLYLCETGIPARLFADLRVHYRPPFGASPLLALHPNDD